MDQAFDAMDESTREGVLLRPLRPFPPAELDEVYGHLGYDGPARTLEEMVEAFDVEARKRQR